MNKGKAIKQMIIGNDMIYPCNWRFRYRDGKFYYLSLKSEWVSGGDSLNATRENGWKICKKSYKVDVYQYIDRLYDLYEEDAPMAAALDKLKQIHPILEVVVE